MKYKDCKKCPKELCAGSNKPIIYEKNNNYDYIYIYGPCKKTQKRFKVYLYNEIKHFCTLSDSLAYIINTVDWGLEHTLKLTKIKSQITAVP